MIKEELIPSTHADTGIALWGITGGTVIEIRMTEIKNVNTDKNECHLDKSIIEQRVLNRKMIEARQNRSLKINLLT